jgi:putative spermidine/putrescine transport system substrate-binding protein
MLKPEYKGRIGLVSMGSTLGSAWMAEIARINGGSEENMEPAFDFVKKLLPNVGAVAANPGVLATLFQQGQIDFSVHYINNIEALKAKGVPVALARPDSNWGLVRSTMHIVKNTKVPELAAQYINTALSLDVQQKMSDAPYFVAPTNKGAKFGGSLAAIAKSMEELEGFRSTDWLKLNPRRAEYIDRFNREVKV